MGKPSINLKCKKILSSMKTHRENAKAVCLYFGVFWIKIITNAMIIEKIDDWQSYVSLTSYCFCSFMDRIYILESEIFSLNSSLECDPDVLVITKGTNFLDRTNQEIKHVHYKKGRLQFLVDEVTVTKI